MSVGASAEVGVVSGAALTAINHAGLISGLLLRRLELLRLLRSLILRLRRLLGSLILRLRRLLGSLILLLRLLRSRLAGHGDVDVLSLLGELVEFCLELVLRGRIDGGHLVERGSVETLENALKQQEVLAKRAEVWKRKYEERGQADRADEAPDETGEY